MERNNQLSDNLKAYQRERDKTLSEFSRELGIAKSTLQSVMTDGNTTVDTLIRIANALDLTLDALVFGVSQEARMDQLEDVLSKLDWYACLPVQKQTLFRYQLNKLLQLLSEAQ